MFSEESFSCFLQKIYLLDNFDRYRLQLLEELRMLIPFESAVYFLVQAENDQFSVPVQYNLDSKCFSNYSKHYHQFDIYKEIVFSQKPIPLTDRSSDYLNYNEWAKNEHRADFLLKNDIYHLACLQIFKPANEGLMGELSLHRRSDQKDFSDDEIRLLQFLSPHIQNSLHNQLRYQNITGLEKLLDHLFIQNHQDGILVLDSNFRILFMNNLGDLLLSQTFSTSQLDIRTLLKNIYTSQPLNSNSTFVLAKRDFSQKIHLNNRIYLLKTSLIHLENNPGPFYLCEFISENNFSSDFLVFTYKKNLTTKESLILKLILDGKTNPEIAKEFVLSIHTVKTHVKNILAKCGVNSRLELMRDFNKIKNIPI